MYKKTKLTPQEKLNNVIKNQLPPFARAFFNTQRDNMTESSLLAYALDLAAFFKYWEEIKDKPVSKMTYVDLESVSKEELENYMEYSKVIVENGKERPRSQYALRRRVAILHSFYNFYYVRGDIDNLPTLKITRPKQPLKSSVMPSVADNEAILNFVMNEDLPTKAALYQDNYRDRDTAILALICYLGLSTSECSNLNLYDLDLEHNKINISTRKISTLEINDFIKEKLANYLNFRFSVKFVEYGHEEALFLSSQMKRINTRSIQRMIKKYTTALFGEENTLVGKDFRNGFKTRVYNSSKSVSINALLSGNSPERIYNQYKADLDERISKA